MSPACLNCCMRAIGSDAEGGAAGAGTADAGGGVGTAGVGVVFLDVSACFASRVARAPFPRSESIVTPPCAPGGLDEAGIVGVGTCGVAFGAGG